MDLKHKLYDYINEFGWTEESKEQARSLFIAYCYSEMIDIDSRDRMKSSLKYIGYAN